MVDTIFARRPIAYEQVTGLTAAKGLTAATFAGATMAVLEAEAQDIRFRDDGVDPTATVGMILKVGVPYEYVGNLAAIKFFQTAATAILNVSYYKVSP